MPTPATTRMPVMAATMNRGATMVTPATIRRCSGTGSGFT